MRQLFGGNANGFSASCSLCAHSQTWRLRRPKRKAYNLRSQQRHGARFTVGYIYNQNINVLIKYINVIPDFSVPDLLLRSTSDQDNLTPSLLPSSLLSHLYWIIRVLFPIPIQSPTSDHSGPIPHQMLAHNKIQFSRLPVHYNPVRPLANFNVTLGFIYDFLAVLATILA